MPDTISPFDRPLTHKSFFNIVYFLLISFSSLILFELSFNSNEARSDIVLLYGIASLCGCVLRWPSTTKRSEQHVEQQNKSEQGGKEQEEEEEQEKEEEEEEERSSSTASSSLTFFDVHDVALNALGLLASHDDATKRAIGLKGGVEACIHCVRVQFREGSDKPLTMCVALVRFMFSFFQL